MKEKILLDGETIYLIPIEEKHIDVYYKKLSNASYESIKNTGSNIEFTREDLENFVNRISKDTNRIDLFIVSKKDNEIVGEVVVNDVDNSNRSANTRIIIYDEKDFNKGYGTQALELAIGYSFKRFNLHRIELTVYSFNIRAIHVYEKLGFKQEGILRDSLFLENHYYDAIVMSILEHEYVH